MQPVCAACRRSVNSEMPEVCGGNGDVCVLFFFSHGEILSLACSALRTEKGQRGFSIRLMKASKQQ